MSVRFTHAHSSSRYDRPPATLEQAARDYAERAQSLSVTEVERLLRRQALIRGLGPGWDTYAGSGNGNGDDTAAGWLGARWRLVYAESYRPTRLRIRRKGSSKLRDPIHATIVVLYDTVARRRMAWAVIHLPSAVERDLAKRHRTARAAQWLAAARGTKRRLNKLSRRYKCHGRAIAADWNINLKRRWARALLKTLAPRYTLAWKSMPAGGTHGSRLIDAVIYRGQLSAWSQLAPDDDSSDHRPFLTHFTWMGVR